jgi:hypothetical protein
MRDVRVTFVPRVDAFGDANNGRTDTGAKLAHDLLTFQEYNMPPDVIASRVNLALDRKLTVPSRASPTTGHAVLERIRQDTGT